MEPPIPPKFKVGDRVISFRHEKATVRTVTPSTRLGKSHRVQVDWDSDREDGYTDDGFRQNQDNINYYEEVFKPWAEE